MREKEIQKRLKTYFSQNPLKNYKTKSGKSIQIVSPGVINVHEGPDFLNFAVIDNSKIVVGNAEFHKKSSDWYSYDHQNDKNYDDIILHIVFDDDIDFKDSELLEVDESAVISNIETQPEKDIESNEELQHFALIRLLRKSSEVQKKINKFGVNKGILESLKDFLTRYMNRRRRPVYDEKDIVEFVKKYNETDAGKFLDQLIDGLDVDIIEKLDELNKNQLYNEGPGLRREIIINCVIPAAVCLANETTRIKLFKWYWSAKAINNYGILRRRFESIPQKYIWQQQGMLEYLKEHGQRKNVSAESIQNYGFAEVLKFYSYGRFE